MSMKGFAPTSPLAPFVRELMLVEVDEETIRVRLPEPGLVLGIRYRGSASLVAGSTTTLLPDATLTGMTGMARRMRTAAGGGIALALFHPGGAAQFFSEPLHELFGATVALDELLPGVDVDRVRSRVGEATTDAQRIAGLEAFLLARLRPETPDPLVAEAVRILRETRGEVRIGALARKLAISQDPFEKRFRRAVGTSAKQLASLLRMRHAVQAYRPGVALGRLATDAGYFDQSHMSRELRAVTGEPAGKFLRAGQYR
jgi:AraC-like DNA-binding protein